MDGLHILANLYRCRGETRYLTDARALRGRCLAAVARAGLTPIGDLFSPFPGADGAPDPAAGVTGCVVLAESHLAIHTWPERDGATLDVYVCNVTCDNSGKAEKLYETLAAALQPADVLVERVWRGRDLPMRKQRLAAVK